MKITLSIQSVADGVYALGALHAATASASGDTGKPSGPVPSLLRREHFQSLRRVCRDVFASIAIELLPMATACNLNENATNDGDILEIEIDERQSRPDSNTLHTLRILAEAAMTAGVMHLAFASADHDLSENFEDEFMRATETIRIILRDACRAEGAMRRKTAHSG